MNLALGELDPNDAEAMQTAPGGFTTVNQEGSADPLVSFGRCH